jgi:allantoinase
MDFDKVLHSTHVVTKKGVKDTTIFIKNGKIVQIESGKVAHLPPDKLEEWGDAVLMPGLIDAHVHINEPGRADWEGFDTATRAAAAGGVTTLIEMPLNASPVTTTVAAFEQKIAATAGKLHVYCGFYGGVVPQNILDLPDLMRAGVFGIKCFLTHSGIDEFPNVTEADLKKAMPLIEKAGLPLLAHAELDTPHPMQAAFDKNPTSYRTYLKSRPKSWENRAIEMMLRLCEDTRCRTHIVHLSSADLISRLKNAKKHLPLTVETTPQYLCFCAEDIPDAQTVYKCAPPIRERANNAKLWKGLKDGTLDFIGSDHSPAPPALKEIASGNLKKAWGGISGLQCTLPVVWTMARTLGFAPEDLATWLSQNPARFLGLTQKGSIDTGMDADFVVWNPDAAYTITAEAIQHRHKISPYIGQQVYGQVLSTYLAGEKIFDGKSLVGQGRGRVLLR